MVSIKQSDKYYRNKRKINKTIVKGLKKNKNIVYGGNALNSHLPSDLKRHTKDYDVFAKKPKKRARELERNLDKTMGGDYFSVKPAQHKGTYKVMSNVTENEVADFSKSNKNISFVTRGGVRVATLPVIEGMLKSSLRNPKSKFRHSKDRDALRRINTHKYRQNKRSKRPKKKVGILLPTIRTKW